MLSTQTNIALQLVATLSPAEMAAFEKEFSKNFATQKAKSVPTKKSTKKSFLDYKNLANQILIQHRAKHEIRCN